MAKRKERPAEEPRELTRKEHHIRARDRDRNRRIMLGTGIALGLALILVVAGLVSEFVIRPNSVVAEVGETQLITRDFWKRTFLEQNRLQNQLLRMSQLEQQFGNQGFFATQINQLQGTLSSPFTLGVEVLDQMIREEVVRQQAAERGITVTEAEIDEAIREEVAGQQGAVTAPQATTTAEAFVQATATAESWTPTPTATVDASGAVTATATPIPTPLPPPTSTILTDEQFTTGLEELEKNLNDIANMSLTEYRKIVEARLLDEKLAEAISSEQVTATEEQVHARHILLEVTEPLTPTTEITTTTEITSDVAITSVEGMTETAAVTVTEEMTGTEEMTATEAVTATEAGTESATQSEDVEASDEVTATGEMTETATMSDTAEMTQTAEMTGTETISETPEVVTRTEAEALDLALDLRQQLLDGADFAALAAEYSSDTTSAVNGGDLGWFGRGRMVAPFEEAAFSLEVGEISEPIRTDFGYHLIEVLEKDAERAKEPSALESERAQAYNTWLEEQIAATPVERPSDMVSKLPRNLEAFIPQLAEPVATVPVSQ